MRGVFIVLEGGDGVGKSTHAARLAAHLEGRGEIVVRTREPGGTDLGREIREIVLHHRGHVDPRAEALLYAADRAQHIATLVRPALERGEIVLQDRYIDSSVAYQGTGRDLGADEIRDLSEWATRGLAPDLVVVLDVDPAEANRRMTSERGTLDRLESEAAEFHARVRDAFLTQAASDPDRYLVVDATQPQDEVADRIRARVDALLALRA